MLLLEEIEKLKHLDHLDDLPIRLGFPGVSLVVKSLTAVHDFLNGRTNSKFNITTKYDGGVSIVFGHEPESDHFFVATKSAFNKTPKLCFSHSDIEKHYKESPGLVKKLKICFDCLKPNTPGVGVFQGDYMYSDNEVEKRNQYLSFTPNTITYSIHKDTPDGRKIANSKLGIVVHTQYRGKTLKDMKANFDVRQDKFNHQGSVHFIDPNITEKPIYTSTQEKDFSLGLLKIKQQADILKNEGAFDVVKAHEQNLMRYINNSIKKKTDCSTQGFISFLKANEKKELEKSKDKKKTKENFGVLIQHTQQNNKPLQDFFDFHILIQDTKLVLINALSSKTKFKMTINDKDSKPEGFVAILNGDPIKLVDRKEFSSANFDWNQKADPADNPIVFSFGRMNPPTIGHGKLIDKVLDLARRSGAQHKIVLSKSQDKDKNPLAPKDKLEHAKKMFPHANLQVAHKSTATIIDQLKDLNKSGVKDLTVVVGSDRKEHFEKLLNQYNKKLFDFKKIRVVSAGERDEKDEGVSGMSASKMRQHAKKNDFKGFRSGLPSHLTNDQALKMFDDVRHGMKMISIGPFTPGISLARYAKRGDALAKRALEEISRRKVRGEWSGA